MDATSPENACRFSNLWLSRLAAQTCSAYEHTFRTFAHSPRPMLRSVLYALEQQLPEMFAAVRSTVFRTWDKPTVVSDFVLRWKLKQGLAQMRDYSHMHFSTGAPDSGAQLQLLSAYVGKLDFFCINDTTDDALAHDPRLLAVRQTLQLMFPVVSSFEANQHQQVTQQITPA